MKEIGIDNVALAGLSSRVSVYTVSGATLAYGYAHSTPAALNKVNTPKSCKDDKCITVSVAERNLRRQSSKASVYTVSNATLAYGYAHLTPAALNKETAPKFRRNDKYITVSVTERNLRKTRTITQTAKTKKRYEI